MLARGDDERIFAAADDYLYALDARTGRPIPSFGERGRIDLRKELDRDPVAISLRLTSPGLVYKDLLIVGGRATQGRGAATQDMSGPTTFAPANSAGSFTPSLVPASPGTRPGPRPPGPTAAAPITGPAWRSTTVGESSTCPGARRPPIFTARIDWAITCLPTA